MIYEAGVSCELVVKEMAEGAEEWDEPTVEKRYPFIGVFLSPKEKTIGGSLVAAGEMKVIAHPMSPPLTREKALTARIIRKDFQNGDETWVVNAFEDIRPALTSVLYKFKVTR